MDIINKIQNYIISNEIESAYEVIIENENKNKYKTNHIYWNLKGMLCSKINKYSIAINCFKTSLTIKESYTDSTLR